MAQSELFRRGLEQLKAGKYEEAKRLFQQNEEASGTAAETKSLLQQAEKRMAEGDLAGAAQLLNQSLERNPGLPEVYLGLARLSIAIRELDAARTHATEATRVGPDLGLSWTLLGLVHEAQGDTAAALGHMGKGVELSPSVFLCQFTLGRALAAAGRPAEGIGPLRKATELEPPNPRGFYVLGMAYKQARQPADAIKSFEQATVLAPKNPDTWAMLANVLFEQKQFQAARDTLDRGLAASGEYPELLEKAMASAAMLSDVTGAIAYVERALEVAPQSEQSWLNLARLWFIAKDVSKSEWAARELLKLNPNSWEAWFHMGSLFEAVAQQAQAEEAYRKAMDLAPDNWKPVTNLAALFIQMDSRAKNSEAVPLLEQAQMLAPKGEWRVQYNLALAYMKLGKRERALGLARKIVREAPADDPIVQEARTVESNLLEAASQS